MQTKSIHISFSLLTVLFLTSCMQDLVEKNYTPTVEGYKQDDSVVFAVNNKTPSGISTQNKTSSNNIPVLYTDPYAVGRNIGQTATVATSIYNTLQPTGYGGNSIYGSLGSAPAGTFNQGILIPNTTPMYQQPSYGNNNIYTPQRR